MPLSEHLAQTFGTPNEDVTHWGCRRWKGGKSETLTYPDGNGVHHKVWPLGELSAEEVRARWGAGDFQVYWMQSDPDNPEPRMRFRSQGNGLRFQLDPEPMPRVAPPQAPPAAPTPFAGVPGFADAMAFMTLADQRASAQLTQTLQLASALLGNRNDGLTPDALERILDRQATATANAVRAAVEPLASEVAAIRREQARTRETEPPPSGAAATVAKEAVRRYRPGVPAGEQIRSAIAEAVIKEPMAAIGVVRDLVQAAPAAIDAVSKAAAAANAVAPPKPRATLRVVEQPPPAPAPPPPPPSPGLNALASSNPAPAPAASPGLNSIATSAQ